MPDDQQLRTKVTIGESCQTFFTTPAGIYFGSYITQRKTALINEFIQVEGKRASRMTNEEIRGEMKALIGIENFFQSMVTQGENAALRLAQNTNG